MTEMTHQEGSTADPSADGSADRSADRSAAARSELTPDPEPRCPECGALRPPAVTWCTQCYARFDVPQALVQEQSSDATGAPAAEDAPAAGDAEDAGIGEPGLGPSAPLRPGASATPVAPEEVEARAQELLARLADEGAGDARVRSWSGRVQGTGPKAVAMLVGTLVLTAVLFGAMAVLGALL